MRPEPSTSAAPSNRSLPLWGGIAAAAAALTMLTLYVVTVQSSVQRGESLRQARQAADAAALVTRYSGRAAGAEPARR